MNTGEREPSYPEPQPDSGGALRESPAPPRGTERDEPSPEQIAIYRSMTPGRRLEIAEQMYWSARRMKSAWLKSQHPDWSEQQVEAEVRRLFANARS